MTASMSIARFGAYCAVLTGIGLGSVGLGAGLAATAPTTESAVSTSLSSS